MGILKNFQSVAEFNFCRDLFLSKKNYKSHIPEMDGLRGIAILLVVIFHIWQLSWIDFKMFLHSPVDLDFIPRYGFIGVEVFFFVSGFCLFYTHTRNCFEQYPLASVGAYIRDRALKILPSYYLAILVILCLFKWDFPEDKFLWHLCTHLFFIHNFFPETHFSINGVFWSLAVEVQFYVIFPLLARYFRRYPSIVYMLMTCGAITYRQYIMFTKQEGGFLYTLNLNQLPAFLDIFAAGMLTAYLLVWLRNRKLTARFMPFFTLLMLSGIAGFIILLQSVGSMASLPDGLIEWQGRYRSLVGITLMGMAIGGHFANSWVQIILSNRFLAFFSFISFNLYIWYQFIGAKLFHARFPEPRTLNPHDDPQWQVIFTFVSLVFGVLVATMLTRFWERPFLNQKVKSILGSRP